MIFCLGSFVWDAYEFAFSFLLRICCLWCVVQDLV